MQQKTSSTSSGKVAWFSSAKGYGFLTRDDGQPDIFCHFSSLNMTGYKSLTQGEDVEFSVEIGPKGKPQAANVIVVRRA